MSPAVSHSTKARELNDKTRNSSIYSSASRVRIVAATSKARREQLLDPGKDQTTSSYSQNFHHLIIAASSFRQWRGVECPQGKAGT